jgi:hypothetical protein
VNTEHPITPPPELVEQWMQAHSTKYDLARQAAQWGANQELEACCEWLPKATGWSGNYLRKHRRPKPPSLKEQALKALDHICVNHSKATDHECTIRRALEALDD